MRNISVLRSLGVVARLVGPGSLACAHKFPAPERGLGRLMEDMGTIVVGPLGNDGDYDWVRTTAIVTSARGALGSALCPLLSLVESPRPRGFKCTPMLDGDWTTQSS